MGLIESDHGFKKLLVTKADRLDLFLVFQRLCRPSHDSMIMLVVVMSDLITNASTFIVLPINRLLFTFYRTSVYVRSDEDGGAHEFSLEEPSVLLEASAASPFPP